MLARVAAAVAILSAVMPAHAAPSPIDVDASGCKSLDAVELEGLTRLELKSEAESPLTVRYGCEGSELTIAIESVAAGTRIVRRVAGGWQDDVEPERTVALLAVGLFRAAHALLRPPNSSEPLPAMPSARELASAGVEVEALPSRTGEALAPPASAVTARPASPLPAPAAALAATPPGTTAATAPGSAPPPISAPPARTLAPSNRAPSAPDAATTGAAARPHELAAAAGVRAHNTAALLPMLAVKVGYRYWPLPSIGVGPMFSAEFGSTGRAGGDVDARIFNIGATGAIRMLERGPFQLLGEIETTASVVQIEGDATVNGYTGDAIPVGVTGNVGALLVPSFGIAGTHVGLALGAGYLFRAPRGVVDGDEPVQVDGGWLSASAVVQVGLGRRTPAPKRGGR